MTILHELKYVAGLGRWYKPDVFNEQFQSWTTNTEEARVVVLSERPIKARKEVWYYTHFTEKVQRGIYKKTVDKFIQLKK